MVDNLNSYNLIFSKFRCYFLTTRIKKEVKNPILLKSNTGNYYFYTIKKHYEKTYYNHYIPA